MSRHPDVEAVHEPFTDCYYFSARRRSDRYGDQPRKLAYGAPDVEAQLDAVTAPLVLIKDLCFQAEPYVPRDRLASAWTSVFVVRHPARVWPSLAKLKPDFTEDEFGFTALERMWERVVKECGQPGWIVEGDQFRRNPASVLRDVCSRLGLSFQPPMTTWHDGRIREWAEDERESQQKWHRVLEGSHGVLPPAPSPPKGWEPRADRTRRRIYHEAVEIYDWIMDQGHVAGST